MTLQKTIELITPIVREFEAAIKKDCLALYIESLDYEALQNYSKDANSKFAIDTAVQDYMCALATDKAKKIVACATNFSWSYDEPEAWLSLLPPDNGTFDVLNAVSKLKLKPEQAQELVIQACSQLFGVSADDYIKGQGSNVSLSALKPPPGWVILDEKKVSTMFFGKELEG
jgi:hypothetical protein